MDKVLGAAIGEELQFALLRHAEKLVAYRGWQVLFAQQSSHFGIISLGHRESALAHHVKLLNVLVANTEVFAFWPELLVLLQNRDPVWIIVDKGANIDSLW